LEQIELSIEKKNIRIGLTAAFSALVFVIGFAVAVGRWQEGVERRLYSLEQSVPALEEKVSDSETNFAAIRTDLAWIKTTLLRIEERRDD